MIFRALFLLIVLTSMANIDCLMCFDCGYLELVNGTKVPLIEEQFGKVPFCNDFAPDGPRKVAAPVTDISAKSCVI